jgi:hypothetical protein
MATYSTHSIQPVPKGDTVPKVTLTIEDNDNLLVDFTDTTFEAELKLRERGMPLKTLSVSAIDTGILEVSKWVGDIQEGTYHTCIKATFPNGDVRTVSKLIYTISGC